MPSIYTAPDGSRFSSLEASMEYVRFRSYFTDLEHLCMGSLSALQLSVKFRRDAQRKAEQGFEVRLPSGSIYTAGSEWPNGYIQHPPDNIRQLVNHVHAFREKNKPFHAACNALWTRLVFTKWETGREFASRLPDTSTGMEPELELWCDRSQFLVSADKAA